MPGPERRWTRAGRVLTGLVLLTSVACSDPGASDGTGAGPAAGVETTAVGAAPSPSSPSSAPTSATTVPTLPAAPRWVPPPDEVFVPVKQAAADVLWAIGNHPLGGGTVEAARARVDGLVTSPGVADAASPLVTAGVASRLRVVYPQMSIVDGGRAVLLAVVEQTTASATGQQSHTRTVEVRLAEDAGRWLVSGFGSFGGEPTDAAPPGELARRVLEHPDIELPDSAVWDLRAGLMYDPLLERLLALAERHPVSVAVMVSGHAREVYAGSGVSNHAIGRAVDLWAIDGVPIVELRDDDELRRLVGGELAAGVTEVGSPWDLDGPGGSSFTDPFHQDHLHLAFDD